MQTAVSLPEFVVCEAEAASSIKTLGALADSPMVTEVSEASQPVDTAVGPQCCCQQKVCYQMFETWFVQQGRAQRPDVTLFDRLEIARRYWDPERSWGEVIRLTEEYDLSRRSIYDIKDRIALFFRPHLPGPVAGLKQLSSGVAAAVLPAGEGEVWSGEAVMRLTGRLILTAVFPGGATMRPLEDILAEVPQVGCSDSTIWRKVNQAGAKASQILQQVDFGEVAVPKVLVAIDETFFDGRPIFFVVEPISLAICGFHVPADGNRAAITWAPFLLVLKEDQHLHLEGGVADGATAYPGTFESLLERDDQLQEDIFHTERDLHALRRKLENSAYRAFKAEYQAADQYQRQGIAEAQTKLAQAQAESLRLATCHDAFAEYCTWVVDAFEIVDLNSGEIRDHQLNEWLLDAAIAAMADLDHPEVVKMSEHLHNHKPRLLTYLNWLDEQLPSLQADLHAYLNDPDLEKAVLRTVARHWRLEHEVQSHQHRGFRPALARAKQEMALWIESDPFLVQWAAQLHTLLESTLRASSAVENINSIFKPLVNRKKHFANPDTAHNFVALFVLWHNLRVFKEGKRQGKSPFEILGIDLDHKDWRTLLGYAPLQ
jgi:hypothetical protein